MLLNRLGLVVLAHLSQERQLQVAEIQGVGDGPQDTDLRSGDRRHHNHRCHLLADRTWDQRGIPGLSVLCATKPSRTPAAAAKMRTLRNTGSALLIPALFDHLELFL